MGYIKNSDEWIETVEKHILTLEREELFNRILQTWGEFSLEIVSSLSLPGEF